MKNCVCVSFKGPLHSYADVVARCELSQSSAAMNLQELRRIPEKWLTLRECKTCGSLFAEELPFGETHGGGPACIYAIEPANLDEWLAAYEPLTSRIRQAHEDGLFLLSLGEEVGPEKCRREACAHLRIRNSVMCRCHHFEMIMGRPCAV